MLCRCRSARSARPPGSRMGRSIGRIGRSAGQSKNSARAWRASSRRRWTGAGNSFRAQLATRERHVAGYWRSDSPGRANFAPDVDLMGSISPAVPRLVWQTADRPHFIKPKCGDQKRGDQNNSTDPNPSAEVDDAPEQLPGTVLSDSIVERDRIHVRQSSSRASTSSDGTCSVIGTARS